MMRQEGGSAAAGSSSSSSVRCQDCGNQAKKDCGFSRCRTCCKTRGFQCPTHVKSTWVPVSKRRPRHPIPPPQLPSSSTSLPLYHHHHYHHPPPPKPKRSRDNNSISIEGNFPTEVSAPAVFRCVRVSSMDNVVDQVAYQASVNIAGHAFKGVLYDQGPDHHYNAAETSYGGGGGGGGFQLQPNNLIAPSASTSTPSPHSSYPSPFSAFMPATQIFPYSKS